MKLTQGELAKELKTDEKYISSFETGKRVPGSNMVQRLCPVLNISEQELRFGKAPDPKPYYPEPVQKVIDMLMPFDETAQWEWFLKIRKEIEKGAL